MEPKKSNNLNIFQNFKKLQKDMMEPLDNDADLGATSLQLDDLFKFFEENFNEFHQKENLQLMLSFVHRSLKVWIRRDYMKDDIGIPLMYFMKSHENEDDLNIVLQIVYQILNSINYSEVKDVQISEKLLRELITIITSIKNRNLIACSIACIQMYIKMFPESKKQLIKLWSNIKSQLETNFKFGITADTEIDILIHLIDDFQTIDVNFFKDPVLVSTIQHLIKSEKRKNRKCGYFLLKKINKYYMDAISIMWMSAIHIQNDQFWIMYITILENLEEEQSHLILPSLENLKELTKSQHLQSSWLNILYMKILTHNNSLVIRWSIEFFLKTFSISDLCEDVVKALLQATNSNLLYNYEGYFLNTDYISSFLKGNLNNLLTLLPEIVNWKSIPLYLWLESLIGKQLPKSLTYEMILKISACVRKLQNCTIRKNAIKICHTIFNNCIEDMSMEEYVTFVETLYNPSDKYDDHETFFKKKDSLIGSNLIISIFTQRFYEIFINNLWNKQKLFSSFLKDIHISKHGFLKYALIELELLYSSNKKCLNELYNLDLTSSKLTDLHEIIDFLKNVLLHSEPFDKHELRECQQVAISYYMSLKPNFDNENEDALRFIIKTDLNKINMEFFKKRLRETKKINVSLLNDIFEYDQSLDIITICDKKVDAWEMKPFVILNFEKIEWSSCFCVGINILKHCTDKWFKELASKGENRIEQIFCFQRFRYRKNKLFELCMQQISIFSDEEFCLNLLKYHIDLTKKKPRYFENSNEHRIKLRIAMCILKFTFHWLCISACTISTDILDQIWNIILNENNQLNITYLYELFLGRYEIRENVILNKLEKLHSFSSSQQVSIISILCIYFLRKITSLELKQNLITKLLSISMGANFQTRTTAQMSLYKLLHNPAFKSIPFRAEIIKSIENAAGLKLEEYLNDIRLHMYDLDKNDDTISITNAILYVTNAPFDIIYQDFSEIDDILIKKCREIFLKKFKDVTNEKTTEKCPINDVVQRKMNPVNDLIVPHNLIAYPTEEKSAEMFVIASLIDKLPNLGGIARTCEVLGIQNLVMDSKMHTEKNDFKNLSMTAEKTLNIYEVKPKDLSKFLMDKKMEGYSIVGAEQTSNSQNFNNFKFPQKCILLLGHEKDGIPAPLLSLLDYAVEIPQFGQVRSLNVHVTGALFMWEFCKQHLVKKEQ